MRLTSLVMLLSMAACAHSLSRPTVAKRAVVPLVPVAAVPELPPEQEFKLPDYDGRTFLEKTRPTESSTREVYVTLNPADAPMSLERRTIERAAQECLRMEAARAEGLEVTMTLDTRADGTLADASYDGASQSLGMCLTSLLAQPRLHEEGKTTHLVIVLDATWGSNVWLVNRAVQ